MKGNVDVEIRWPDYAAMRDPDKRHAAIVRDTIEVIARRNPSGRLAEFLRTKPMWAHQSAFGFAPWAEPNAENCFDDDLAEKFIEVIVNDLNRPKRRQKSVNAMEEIFRSENMAARDLLRARLGRDRLGSKRRSVYDRTILQMLHMISRAIHFDWDDGAIKFDAMPTPGQVAVEYYLKVQDWPAHDRDRAREVIEGELEKFSSRPRG